MRTRSNLNRHRLNSTRGERGRVPMVST